MTCVEGHHAGCTVPFRSMTDSKSPPMDGHPLSGAAGAYARLGSHLFLVLGFRGSGLGFGAWGLEFGV